jgi:hypothetical protein
VVTLTTLYGAGLRFIDIHAVARHICRIEIDDGPDLGDLDLVHRIANPLEDEEFWRYYSFATKYCSFHRPQTFAIYDQYVERLLWEYAEKDRFSVFRRNQLVIYREFSRVLDDFVAHFQLNRFSRKEIDKCLWLYGKERYGPRG